MAEQKVSHAIAPPATVAVTGASGFVGSHVCKALLARGFRVRAAVRDPANEAKTAHLKALPARVPIPHQWASADALELCKGDLSVDGSYDEAFAGCEAVVHCAAEVHVKRQGPGIQASHLDGTRNVLKSAAKAGTVRRFVQTSSEAAIMDPFVRQDVAFTEANWSDALTLDVGGYYATGKREAERLVHGFAAAHEEETKERVGFDVVSINPSVVIGESMCKAHTKASPVFVRQLLYGNELENVHLNYVDAEDVAAAHVEALVREDASAAPARFIVSSRFHGRPSELADRLQALYPAYAVEAKHPNCMMALVRGMGMTKAEAAFLKMSYTLDNTLSRERLGIEYADTDTTLRRTVDSMVTPGWVEPKQKRAA